MGYGEIEVSRYLILKMSSGGNLGKEDLEMKTMDLVRYSLLSVVTALLVVSTVICIMQLKAENRSMSVWDTISHVAVPGLMLFSMVCLAFNY